MIRGRGEGTSGAVRRRRVTRVKRGAMFVLVAGAVAFGAYHVHRNVAVVEQPGPPQAVTAGPVPPAPPRSPRYADFLGESASSDARAIADWVVDSGDNQRLPFVIVDKLDAKVFVFDRDGRLLGASAALLGLSRGDHSVPGIGEKKISEITPEERTTPAGRFLAEPGVNLNGEQIVWVDYDAALSLHAVRAYNERERRLQRLATPTAADNRISYGCINVPQRFFREVVAPAFQATRGVVYVLPETQPARVVFGSYEVPGRPPQTLSSNTPHGRALERASYTISTR